MLTVRLIDMSSADSNIFSEGGALLLTFAAAVAALGMQAYHSIEEQQKLQRRVDERDKLRQLHQERKQQTQTVVRKAVRKDTERSTAREQLEPIYEVEPDTQVTTLDLYRLSQEQLDEIWQ